MKTLENKLKNSSQLSATAKANILEWLHDSFNIVSENGIKAHDLIASLADKEEWEDLNNRFFEKIAGFLLTNIRQ